MQAQLVVAMLTSLVGLVLLVLEAALLCTLEKAPRLPAATSSSELQMLALRALVVPSSSVRGLAAAVTVVRLVSALVRPLLVVAARCPSRWVAARAVPEVVWKYSQAAALSTRVVRSV